MLLETDRGRARDRARAYLGGYLNKYPNYVNNLLRCGFQGDDVIDGGSDRLIDAVIAWVMRPRWRHGSPSTTPRAPTTSAYK